MSEFDSLRSIFTVLGSTMLCNTSVTASELGKLLVKRRGGIVT